jgi:proteasome lid subunit RPN8/RPN11
MNTISLTAKQVKELVKIAKDAFPNECCAFLLGDSNDCEKVETIIPMQNIDKSPVSFSIDPAELLNAYNLAFSKGMEVCAIFHSHPTKASPSSIDIKYMQINPVIWLIYSTTEYEIRAFVYEDDDIIREIAINIIAAKA